MRGRRRRSHSAKPLMADHPVAWAVLIAVVCALIAVLVAVFHDAIRKK